MAKRTIPTIPQRLSEILNPMEVGDSIEVNTIVNKIWGKNASDDFFIKRSFDVFLSKYRALEKEKGHLWQRTKGELIRIK